MTECSLWAAIATTLCEAACVRQIERLQGCFKSSGEFYTLITSCEVSRCSYACNSVVNLHTHMFVCVVRPPEVIEAAADC